MPLSEVELDNLPFLSVLDSMIFKIHSCGMRPWQDKRCRDASDAEFVTESFAAEGPIRLSPEQRRLVSNGIDRVIEYGKYPREWWIEKLSLQ